MWMCGVPLCMWRTSINVKNFMVSIIVVKADSSFYGPINAYSWKRKIMTSFLCNLDHWSFFFSCIIHYYYFFFCLSGLSFFILSLKSGMYLNEFSAYNCKLCITNQQNKLLTHGGVWRYYNQIIIKIQKLCVK